MSVMHVMRVKKNEPYFIRKITMITYITIYIYILLIIVVLYIVYYMRNMKTRFRLLKIVRLLYFSLLHALKKPSSILTKTKKIKKS